MACIHLRKLYQLCQIGSVRLSSSDLIRIVCRQCGVQDVCPSVDVDLSDAYLESSAESPGGASVPQET